MTRSTNEPPNPDLPDPETAYGGADAVEKTTYVVGEGTDPNARTPKGHPPEVGRHGMAWVGWVVILAAVIVAVVYLLGIARH